MSSLIEKVKEWYSTILGLILMGLSVSGYYFGYPSTPSIWSAVAEFAGGLALVFLDPREIALQAWEVISKKL